MIFAFTNPLSAELESRHNHRANILLYLAEQCDRRQMQRYTLTELGKVIC